MYSQIEKNWVMSLRNSGFSYREISEQTNISLGTIHDWAKGVELTSIQKESLIERRIKPTFTKERRMQLSQQAVDRLAKFWKKPYSKEELLGRIKSFYLNKGRIPLKREFNMHKEYQKVFGSWNNAIRLAGFMPNEVVFSQKHTANDGHICDSFAEKILDDWMFKNKISHLRNVPYGDTKMTADFVIGSTRVEYFGLVGSSQIYDFAISKKRKFCEENGLNLIEIYPSELFSKNFRKCLRSTFEIIKTQGVRFTLA